MSSKELNAEVQEQINVYTVNARECFKNKDFDGLSNGNLKSGMLFQIQKKIGKKVSG